MSPDNTKRDQEQPTLEILCSRGLRYTTGSQQPTTVDLFQRGLVDGPRQGGRGAPSSSLRDEPSGGVENLFIMLRTDKRGIDCRFGKSP